MKTNEPDRGTALREAMRKGYEKAAEMMKAAREKSRTASATAHGGEQQVHSTVPKNED